MVKNIISNIQEAENESKDMEKKAYSDRKSLIKSTEEIIQKLYEGADSDNKLKRTQVMENVEKENRALLEKAIEEARKECSILRDMVEVKKDKVIDEIISSVI